MKQKQNIHVYLRSLKGLAKLIKNMLGKYFGSQKTNNNVLLNIDTDYNNSNLII